jgi:hypothetical protein
VAQLQIALLLTGKVILNLLADVEMMLSFLKRSPTSAAASFRFPIMALTVAMVACETSGDPYEACLKQFKVAIR